MGGAVSEASGKDPEGWQTGVRARLGLGVMAVHVYEFGDKNMPCPVLVSMQLGGPWGVSQPC